MKNHNKAPWIILGTVLLIAVAAAAFFIGRGIGATPPAPSPTPTLSVSPLASPSPTESPEASPSPTESSSTSPSPSESPSASPSPSPTASPTPTPSPSPTPTPTPTPGTFASKTLNLRFTAPKDYTMASQGQLDNWSTDAIRYEMYASSVSVTGEYVSVCTVAVAKGSTVEDYFAALEKSYANVNENGVEYAVKRPDAPETFAGEKYYVGSVVGTWPGVQTTVSTLFVRILSDGKLVVIDMTAVVDQSTANQRDFFSKY